MKPDPNRTGTTAARTNRPMFLFLPEVDQNPVTTEVTGDVVICPQFASTRWKWFTECAHPAGYDHHRSGARREMPGPRGTASFRQDRTTLTVEADDIKAARVSSDWLEGLNVG